MKHPLAPIFIDFEYQPQISHNELVCCVTLENGTRNNFWLYKNRNNRKLLKNYLVSKRETHYFCAFAANAEAECFIDLGLNPRDFQWMCLRVEGLPHVHSSSAFAKWVDSSETFKQRKKIADSKNETRSKIRSKTSLVSYLRYFCNFNRDIETKEHMIKLILSTTEFDEQLQRDILDYCFEDVDNLPLLFEKLITKNRRLFASEGEEYQLKHVLARGRFVANTACYMRNGLPIDIQLLNIIQENKENIITEMANLASQFFLVEYPTKRDKLQKTNGKHVEKYEALEQFIIEHKLTDWPKTETNKYKRDEETLKQYQYLPEIYNYREAKKTMSSLRAFSEKTDTKQQKLTDFICPLSQSQHPYYGIFGTITSRNAPAANSFILAQASWSRILLRPKCGYSVISADFSSQEVWIAACISEDEELMHAYLSGDVYLSFGKSMGVIPPDGTKDTHAKERNICKAIILGIQFGMGVRKLAASANVELDTAKQYLNYHKRIYKNFWNWRENYIKCHEFVGLSVLKDGWWLMDNTAYKDTDKYAAGDHYALTTGNFPIQGHGAAIMRKAIDNCFNKNLFVLCPLHDEIIIMCHDKDVNIASQLLISSMQSACEYFFPGHTPCRINLSTCSHDELYLEDKGINALKAVGKYIGVEYKDHEFIRTYENSHAHLTLVS